MGGIRQADMKIKVTEIEYDIDETDRDSVADLPAEMVLDLEHLGIDDVTEDNSSEIADAISDRTGFCVRTFYYEPAEE